MGRGPATEVGRGRDPGALALALTRKLLKRCYHTLRELGDEALLPA